MKRSPLITIVIVLQFLLGLLLAGFTVYLLVLTRSPETLAEPESADTIRGLLIGAGVLGVPGVITLVSAFGLWKRRFWGWVLAFATDVGILAAFVYSMTDENNLDGEMVALTVACVVPLVLLMVPVVRRYYWNSAASTTLGPAGSSGVSS